VGTFGLPDTPRAKTSCLGCSTISSPPRSTVTVHSFVASSQVALFAVVEPQ
jgi:hypothetical protein